MDKIQNSRIFSEIHQQPDVIRELVTHPQDSIKALVEQIRSRGIHHVLIAARGTSKNAGRYAQYLLGAHNQLAVGLTTPSLFTIYKPVSYTHLDVYKRQIQILMGLATRDKLVLFCSEGNPAHCHRQRTIAQTLLASGVKVVHIRCV